MSASMGGAMPAGGAAMPAGPMMPFGPAGLSGAHAPQHAGAAILIGAYQHQHQHKHQHDALLCVLGLALLQMGLGLPGHAGHQGSGPMVVGAAAASGASSNNTGQHAMHQMLHSVVQATKKHSQGSGFDSELQGLIGAMSAGQAGGQSTHPAFKQLQQDFTQMVSALHGPTAVGTQLNVVNFLQNMQANLGGASLPMSGGLVNTSA